MKFKHLFSPIVLGKVEVKNRIALAPMGLGILNPDATVPDRILPYLEARSRGGAGLIISQFANVSKYQKINSLGAYDDRFVPGLSKYADAIHKYGAKAFLQLATLGGKHQTDSYAPSAIESPLYPCRQKEFSRDQVSEVIQEFVQAGRRAREAGFDGVELHGAHSYLIGQFISPHFNRRDDEYGGDFERRMRVPSEIVRGIKNLCGRDFPIGFKFSAWEELPDGVDHRLAAKIARKMANEGVAYIHPQTTAFHPPLAVRSRYPTMPPMYSPRNTLLQLAEKIKRIVRNVPVMAAGGIVEPRDAEKMIAGGRADMAALGRALLADPEWPNKAREGRRIRPCIRCNVCHYEVVSLNKEAACTVNPYLVHELDESVNKVERPKGVMVVGAGPGGIVAALTASRLGHEVTLYETRDQVGGLLVPGSAPPFKSDVGALLQYYREEVQDSQVKLKVRTKVTCEMIKQLHPDALIIAVGAKPLRPDIPGIDRDIVLTADEALLRPNRVKGRNVVIIGGGSVGCETALYFAKKRKKVVVLEALDDLFPLEEVKNNTVVLEEMLEDAGVRAYTGSKVIEITPDEVWTIRKGERMQKLPADTVILAVGLKPDSSFVDALRGCCPESYAIGDCVKPARIFEAVHEADRIARLL